MTTTQEVVLYDIPSKSGNAWSLNPWKTRLVLNYKNIPYTTQWTSYPSLAATLSALSIPPNSPSTPGYSVPYTTPAILLPSGSGIMDSWAIAQALETQYPSPPLHLDDPIVVRVRDQIGELIGPLRFHVLTKVPHILPEDSAKYYLETREKRFGAPLAELEKGASEQDWEKVKAPAGEVGAWLRERGGPFFLGETVSYADFIFVAMLHFLKAVDVSVFERFVGLDEAFGRVYEASKEWFVKDD